MNDVFICYSPEDENIASSICNLLENNNYKCWYKKRDYGEDDSIIKVTEAVKDSKSLILIYSKDAKKSNFVTTEVDIAFSSNVEILIFCVDDSTIDEKLQFYLKDKPIINAYPNTCDYYDELLKDINEYLGVIPNDNVIAESINEAYICYADEDVLTAEAIAHVLEENGIKCWFRKRDLKVSKTVKEVSQSIKNSKSFILVYSDSASKSNFVKTDTDLAISANIPILSFKIEDIKKSDKLSDSHWLDAYPNPEDNFDELVFQTGQLIGKSIVNPKITKSYKDLKKVEKVEKKLEKENKSITKRDTSKRFNNRGISKSFKIIVAVVVILAIIGGCAFFLTSTTTNIGSEINIPEGFHENTTFSYTENSVDGYTEYKFYENNDSDYFDVTVIHQNQGISLSDDEPGYVDKTINGVEGLYNSDKISFKYVDSKGNQVLISASSDKLLEEIVK